jgi:hypothetical protein
MSPLLLLPLGAISLLDAPARAAALPATLALPERQEAPTGDGPPTGGESTSTTPPAKEGYGTRGNRTYLMQVNARVRYLSVPSSVIDPWFYDSDDEGANPYDRPKVRGWAFGGEYVFDLEPGNYVIYGEYIHSTMGEGYWDDVEEPADHDDGDWIRPDGFGGVVFGASYLHEIDAIPTGPDASDVGLSFLFGAGLGLVVVTGGLEEWHPGSNPDNLDPTCGASSPAYDRVERGCGSDGYKRIPKVLPMVDLSASARVNFSDHFHIRVDGGLHDVLSLGTAMGVVF